MHAAPSMYDLVTLENYATRSRSFPTFVSRLICLFEFEQFRDFPPSNVLASA